MTAQNKNEGNYKGIGRNGDKFQAKIIYDDENLYVGRYDRSVEAAYAFNFAQSVLNPDDPQPNEIPPTELTDEQRNTIEENVMRLLHPRRAPFQRKADEA